MVSIVIFLTFDFSGTSLSLLLISLPNGLLIYLSFQITNSCLINLNYHHLFFISFINALIFMIYFLLQTLDFFSLATLCLFYGLFEIFLFFWARPACVAIKVNFLVSTHFLYFIAFGILDFHFHLSSGKILFLLQVLHLSSSYAVATYSVSTYFLLFLFSSFTWLLVSLQHDWRRCSIWFQY